MLFNRTFINTSALPTRPVITLQPVAQSIVVGQTLTFTATASDAISQQWYLDGVAIGGATSTTYTKSNAQLSDDGDYFCRFTNAIGSRDTNTVTGAVVVAPTAPVIVTQPIAQSITVGDTLTFISAATDADSQQWYLDGGAISGATSATYTKSNAQVADDGDYFCRFTNVTGSTDTNTVTGVVALPDAPVITTQPLAQAITLGDTLTIIAAATGATSQQWYLGGVAISGATSATYTKVSSVSGDLGNYFCRFTNIGGDTDTSTVAITEASGVPTLTFNGTTQYGTI